MSESDPSVGSDSSAAMTSPGALLKQGRLASGLHIAALAVALKVPVRRLEALESDQFDLLPDAVFVRALASSVCRALKMDAAPVLALLPAAVPPRLGFSEQRTHEPYTAGDANRRKPMWRSLSRPVMLAVSGLVLATLALVVWPLLSGSWSGPAKTAELVLPATEVMTPAAAPDLSAPPLAVPAEVAGAPAALPAPVITAVTAIVSTSAAPAAPFAAPAAPAAPAVASPAAPVTLTNGIIVFRPSAASWVEVTDAKGTVLLRRMLTPGEVVGASGALPLSAVVGRADATKVQVRGQAFDLSSIARDNVARFEVK